MFVGGVLNRQERSVECESGVHNEGRRGGFEGTAKLTRVCCSFKID